MNCLRRAALALGHRAVSTLALLLLVSGCSLLAFPDASDIRYHPSGRNQVLAREDQPWVEFGFAVDRRSAEQLLSLRFLDQSVSGRLTWRGSRLLFVAEPPLVVGRRYQLHFSGTFQDRSGSNYRAATVIPFYFVSATETEPRVLETVPASGARIAADQPVVVRFSKPMAMQQVERSLSPRPGTEFRGSWNQQHTELTLTPLTGWRNGTTLNFTFSNETSDFNAIPMERALNLTYQVHDGSARPEVSALESIAADFGADPPLAGPGVNLLQSGATLDEESAIRVTFTAAMDAQATQRAFTIQPSVAGSFYWPRSDVMVFVPVQRYQTGIDYLLSLSTQAADRAGNRLRQEVSLIVGASIAQPRLLQLSLLALDGGSLSSFSDHSAHQLTPGLPPHYPYTLVLRFSHPFTSDRDKLALLDAVSLISLLPGSFSNPYRAGYSWISDTLLSVTFHQLSVSTANRRNYLLLSVPVDVRQLFVTGEQQ